MAPLGFLNWLRAEFRNAGIRFALTSGQACVCYGIQQTTKDSDWIIAVEHIERLRRVFRSWDSGGTCRANYRSICGAPLDPSYLQHGWTSHFTVVERDTGVEHHVDIFGKPPRVPRLETDPDDADLASRQVVAQMKKTDRDKDWPIVFGIGRQMLERADWRGTLHLQDAEPLASVWPRVPQEQRGDLIRQRPLLAMIESSPQRLRRAIAIERTVWIAINQARYAYYQRAWKQFYRRWRAAPDMQWPLDATLGRQHEVLAMACREHDLPLDPFGEPERRTAYAHALADAAEIMAATPAELEEIVPTLEVLLP